MAPRVNPSTDAERDAELLAARLVIQEIFPGAVPVEVLHLSETAVRCKGMTAGQLGRIPCGNTAEPKRGVLCEDPRGCRSEGRGYPES